MNHYLNLFLITYGMALGIVVLVWFCANTWAKTPEKKYKYYAIPALVLSICCIATSWNWVYYANFFFSLPFFIASLWLMYLAWRNGGKGKLLKTVWWFQSIAVFVSLVSIILFSIVK